MKSESSSGGSCTDTSYQLTGCGRPGSVQYNKCEALLKKVINGQQSSGSDADDCNTCDFAVYIDCKRLEKPTSCCLDGNDLCSTKQGLTAASGPASYRSRLLSTQAASLSDITDRSKQGYVIGESAASAFDFDRTSSGLVIKALRWSFNDFVFDGEHRKRGSALLAGKVTAVPVPGDPNTYTIPVAAAQFSVLAFDDAGDAYSIGTANTTPLTISGLDDARGPRMTGTLVGFVGGHTVEARLDAAFVWNNRPPVAIPAASNVVGDSRLLTSDSTDPCFVQNGANGPKLNSCFGTEWFGVPHAKFLVRLDASRSYDPDPGDSGSLVYAWTGRGRAVTSGTQPVQGICLPEGSYEMVLTVQDVNFASAVNTVKFTVKDAAKPDCGPPPSPKYVNPSGFLPFPPGDPARTFGPILSYSPAFSLAASIPVSKAAKADIRALGLTPWLASKTLRVALKPDFGVSNLREQSFANPFATACPSDTSGLTGGMAVVCAGCGNGVCSEGETCLTCDDDCGACAECGNARCESSFGESCGTCPGDCGDCNPCGNGRCEAPETPSTCAADCYCGDGLCEAEESPASCAQDCYCGNSTCDASETGAACPNDCRCGDRMCDASETVASCPADCTCGNGECDPAEDNTTCSADCFCGDGRCQAPETEADCPADCQAAGCGDGVCDTAAGEDCTSCSQDCGACPAVCGNGTCESGGGETCATCSQDCGSCPPVCGDGVCEFVEQCEAPLCGRPDATDGCCCADCGCGATCPTACWGSNPQTMACLIL